MNIYKGLFIKRKKKYKEKEEENTKKEEKNEKESNENTKIPIAKSINHKMKSKRSKDNLEINSCSNNEHEIDDLKFENFNETKQKPISKKYMKYSRSIYHPSFNVGNNIQPYYYYSAQTYPIQGPNQVPNQYNYIYNNPYYHYQTYHSQNYRIPFQNEIPFQTQTPVATPIPTPKPKIISKESHTIFVSCPYCDGTVEINETNKMYFRHGIFKSTGMPMQSEIKDDICNQIIKSNAIYGCGKKFIILKSYDSNGNIIGYSTTKI